VLEINTPADLLLAKSLLKALLNHDSNSNYKHSFDWGWLSPVLIGGPCVIESLDFTLKMAEQISMCERLGISFIFKSSLIKPTAPQFNHFEGKL